jgi:hypothetical protein
MTKTIALLAVFLLVLGTFVFAAPRASAQGAAPAWSIGDYWEYAGNGDIMGSEYNLLTRFEVKERTTITVRSTPCETFHLTMRMNMTAGSISESITYDYWVRTSDLADVKFEMDYLSIQLNVTYDPPQRMFNFPLSGDQTWSSTSTMTISGMGMPPSSSTITNGYQVSGPQKVTVPAGTFDSFNVTMTGYGNPPSGPSSTYYSDEVGYMVKTDSPIPGLGASGTLAMELKSFNYQHGSVLVWVVLIVVIIVAGAMAMVAALLVISRKKGRVAPPVPPQAPPFPPQTPPFPPQG